MGDANGNGWPDLYVANDFGRSNLYRNNGNGTFTAMSDEASANDVGAGMSACWLDIENGGKQDIYVSNMWSAAGQRVSELETFMRMIPRSSSQTIVVMRAVTLSTETWETANSGMSARKPESKWAAGLGLQTAGISTTTACRSYVTNATSPNRPQELSSFFGVKLSESPAGNSIVAVHAIPDAASRTVLQ